MSLPPGLLPIAHQLHTSLLREIDHEIEIERMVGDPRYGRDVLLVCDACPGTNLPSLAAQWRGLMLARLHAPPNQPQPAETGAPPMDPHAVPLAGASGSDLGPTDGDTRPGLPPPRPRPPLQADTAVSRLQRWWARWR